MSKDLSVSILLDYYGNMLTEKQREVIELYYNEDLSLGEISELSGITRQGVRDSIKRGEAFLQEMEANLHFAQKFGDISEGLSRIRQMAVEMGHVTNIPPEFAQVTEHIAAIAKTLEEEIQR